MGGIVLVVVVVLDTNRQAKTEHEEENEDDHAAVTAMLERTRLRCIVPLCGLRKKFKSSLRATRRKVCGSTLAVGCIR
jgi:hypothetical protein